MNIENKNIQVATGSPRTISVHLVDAAGAPVTSGVAVELLLTAPLTGAPRIIPAVPQAGTYTITIPADLAPVTNPATGEPIPWHYALRAGASAAVARGSFLSGELHLLPAVLAGDLTSPITLAATYDPDSASVPSVSAPFDGLNASALLNLGLLKMEERAYEEKLVECAPSSLIYNTQKMRIRLASPLTGKVAAVNFWSKVSGEIQVKMTFYSGEISVAGGEYGVVSSTYVKINSGYVYEYIIQPPSAVQVENVDAIELDFGVSVSLSLAGAAVDALDGMDVWAAPVGGDFDWEHMKATPAVGLSVEKTEQCVVTAGGSRLNIQIRVMTEKNKMRTETDAFWRILDPQTECQNLEWVCAADAEMYWQVKNLYFYDGQSWRQSGWEVDVPVQKREAVLEEVESYREAIRAVGGAYVVDVRIFSHE